MQIGFIGTGVMGTGIVKNLLQAGRSVSSRLQQNQGARPSRFGCRGNLG